jgi:hypothetical protein
MAGSTASAEAKVRRLLSALLPHLTTLLENAPDFGSIAIEAFIADCEVGRIEVRTSISRKIPPRADRGPR